MAAINWSNITDFAQIPGAANTATSGSFWSSTFYMLWVILIMLLVGYGFEVAIVVSSFIMMILGTLLVYAGLMAWEHLVSVVALLLFMFLYIIWSSPKVRN
jgi:hypothetical protein